MISTILIDVDDTLLDFDLCAEWAMEKTAREMILSLPNGTYARFKEINALLWKQMGRKEIAPDEIYCTRWNMVSEAIGLHFNGKEFEHYFLDYLSQSVIPVHGANELLEYLGRKYRIFVASNGPYDQQIQRMRLAGMDRFMSGYFVSEKIGHSKPSKEFFDICCKETQVESLDELIMIGDSLSADIQGAHSYGIKTCWFDKGCKGTENPADFTVNYLEEIKRFL